MSSPEISVIIPAYNEEEYVGATLQSLRRAIRALEADGATAEVIVVNNASTDATREVALAEGAIVVDQLDRGIGRARNTGAIAARGETLVFVDADTTVPDAYLSRVRALMTDRACLGGKIKVECEPTRTAVRIYRRLWSWYRTARQSGVARRSGAFGMAQFCRRSMFQQLGGFDEQKVQGEDGDFFMRLGREADSGAGYLADIDDLAVIHSPRRWEKLPLWQAVLYTTPFAPRLLRTSKLTRQLYLDRPPR